MPVHSKLPAQHASEEQTSVEASSSNNHDVASQGTDKKFSIALPIRLKPKPPCTEQTIKEQDMSEGPIHEHVSSSNNRKGTDQGSGRKLALVLPIRVKPKPPSKEPTKEEPNVQVVIQTKVERIEADKEFQTAICVSGDIVTPMDYQLDNQPKVNQNADVVATVATVQPDQPVQRKRKLREYEDPAFEAYFKKILYGDPDNPPQKYPNNRRPTASGGYIEDFWVKPMKDLPPMIYKKPKVDPIPSSHPVSFCEFTPNELAAALEALKRDITENPLKALPKVLSKVPEESPTLGSPLSKFDESKVGLLGGTCDSKVFKGTMVDPVASQSRGAECPHPSGRQGMSSSENSQL